MNNIELFYNNKYIKIKEFESLFTFTSMSRYKRIIFSNFSKQKIIKMKKLKYTITKNNKTYNFECLSDKKILKRDKLNLQDSEKRVQRCILRSLRIASSNKLKDAKLLVGYTNGVKIIIEYLKDGKRYIIDYSNNLIMERDNYIELFDLKIENEISQDELYKIFLILKKVNFNPEMLLYFLLASNEMLKDIAKNENWLNQKFNIYGMNSKNNRFLGEYCDVLYFEYEDKKEKYDCIINSLKKFTLNPNINIKNIYSLDNGIYCYKNYIKQIKFRLLSDYIENSDFKNKLLSTNRFHKCYENSLKLLFELDLDNKYLVNGQVRVNEFEHLYHSWIEYDYRGKTYVIDSNYNLIIEKKDYYKIWGAGVINKSDFTTIKKIAKFITQGDLNLPCKIAEYFSQEILKSIEKQKIFK